MRRGITVLALLAFALASCRNDVGPGPTPVLPGAARGTNAARAARAHGGPIFAIGDSLLNGAIDHGDLEGKLAEDGWVLESLAESGRSTRWAADKLENREDPVPPYVVVVLGSNPGHSADGFADDVNALLAALEQKGAKRILWIPPHHTDPERYAEKVQILKTAEASDAKLVVPDWGAVLDANPSSINSDGIHLDEDGYLALALFIRDELARLG